MNEEAFIRFLKRKGRTADAARNVVALLVAFVERTGFGGIAPLPKEVRGTVTNARKLPRIVEY